MRFKPPKLYSFQSPPCVEHAYTGIAFGLASRTYPKDTQLNNLLHSAIRMQVQGVAQPCNLFTQSISLSNIQSPTSVGAHPQVDRTGFSQISTAISPAQRSLSSPLREVRDDQLEADSIRTCENLVELRRIELLTPCLQSRCSPS